MVTDATPPGRNGFVHEAAVYDSDEELAHLVVPHLRGGVEGGQPTFAALGDHETAVVRSNLDHPAGVTFLPKLLADEAPPAVIKRLTSLLGELAAENVEQVRFVQSIPHPGLGAPWDGWCRYEAAVNELLSAFPVWGLCVYDRRITPLEVLRDVERTHPRLAANGSHLSNDRYQDPKSFILSLRPPPDPLEAEPPAAELADPSPKAARRAVEDLAPQARLAKDEVARLVLAVSEAVTNAIVHGKPPVTMRIWTAPERIVVTVNDRGRGPQDPYSGLLQSRATQGHGGFGLWITHQLVATTFVRDRGGFTIRLVAGRAVA
jgi:anti-sigma regulatory factor (Ser/Thr protein kinase)